jgi:hypothetical protein
MIALVPEYYTFQISLNSINQFNYILWNLTVLLKLTVDNIKLSTHKRVQ